MEPIAYPNPQLVSGRVRLRPWTLEDLDWVTECCRDPELSRYSPVIPRPYTRLNAEEWFATHKPERLAGTSLQLAIVGVDDGERLGAIGLHDVSRSMRTAETGYWLAASARGHGHMTSAVLALLAWAFEELQLARVQLLHDPENIASQAVAQRAGFTREGLLRSNLVVAHSGERRDSVVWSILPAELRTSPRSGS